MRLISPEGNSLAFVLGKTLNILKYPYFPQDLSEPSTNTYQCISPLDELDIFRLFCFQSADYVTDIFRFSVMTARD